MKTNKAGKDLIKAFEGIMDGNPDTVNYDPYLCPAGYWTVGYGHVLRDGKGRMIKGEDNEALARHWCPGGLTKAKVDEMFDRDLPEYENDVLRLVKVALNENQFSALVSFTFNLGEGNLAKSTLLELLNAGDYDGASKQFGRWINPGSKFEKGLRRRREAERMLFQKPVPEFKINASANVLKP